MIHTYMKKLKESVWLLVGLFLLGQLVYWFVRYFQVFHIPQDKRVLIKAVVINEKNYYGNQPVHPSFSYSYVFSVNYIIYKGNSHNSELDIGDSILVEYNRDNPNINKPVHQND
jgi:hypothetical protein